MQVASRPTAYKKEENAIIIILFYFLVFILLFYFIRVSRLRRCDTFFY